MVIIGLDPHPSTHTASAIDESGKPLGSIRVDNTEEGHERLLEWSARFEERAWAVEGATNPFISGWVADLLTAGERVSSISPSLTSQYRSKGTRRKNDEIDALNCARALLANPSLPAHDPPEKQRDLQRLSRTRKRLADDLKANRMAATELEEGSALEEILLKLIGDLGEGIKRIERMMGSLLKEVMPEIVDIQGVGKVLGATILAEVGNPDRFPDEDKFASYCGAAPIDRSSGKNKRVRVNPSGNRTMNWVVHMISRVRLRVDPRSRELVERKQREGKTKREAIRVLKTCIAREVYRTLKRIHEKRRFLALDA